MKKTDYQLGRSGGGSQVYLFESEETAAQVKPGIMRRKACRLCWTAFTCAVTVSVAIFFSSYFTGYLKGTVVTLSCPLGCVCKPVGDYLRLVSCEDLNLKHVAPGFIPVNTTDISLERNMLESLQEVAFSDINRIRVMYLRNNAFSVVTESTLAVFKSLPKLEALDLSDNAWDCSCSQEFQNFVSWLQLMKGPKSRKDPDQWVTLVNGHRTVCHQPENLKDRRLDTLHTHDICSAI